jgi:NADH-quinone oxidoreductase subunit M
MLTDLWLMTLIWALPLLTTLLTRSRRLESVVRPAAIVTAATVVLLSLLAFVRDGSDHAFARSEAVWAPVLFGIRYHVGIDGLSAVLLPMSAGIILAVIVGAPRRVLPPALIHQILLTESLLLGVLVSLDLSVMVLFWVASLVPLLIELRRRREHGAARMMLILGVASSLPLVVFVAMLGVLRAKSGAAVLTPYDLVAVAQRQMTDPLPNWLGVLAMVGALVRMGCFPMHIWIVPLSERGPAPLVLSAFATPLGLFLMTRVPMPLFPELFIQAMPVLLPLGLLTATYGAVLAMAQYDLRRMLGYFWISQQGFLLAGIAAVNAPGVSGSLIHAIGTVVVRTGLALLIAAIYARTGTADMRKLGGLVRSAPRMATGFLLLGVAAVGSPGTLGFVSEDLIVQGLLDHHAIAAVMVLLTTALNGIVLFLAFQRVFLGDGAGHAATGTPFPDLLPRERWVAVALFGLLLGGGLLPAPLLAVRTSVVDALHGIEKPGLPAVHDEPAGHAP